MAKNIKIANKLIVALCIILLIAIGVIIYKSNEEIDFNTITKDTNTTTIIKNNTNSLNTIVDANVISNNVVE